MTKEVAIELLSQIHRLFRNTIRNSDITGCLSMPQIATMLFIKENTNVLLKDISDHLKITNASASVLIKKLEDKNLITKKTNKNDKRASLLTISDEGAGKMKQGKQKMIETVSPFFKNISDQEIDELIQIFQKIISNYKNI